MSKPEGYPGWFVMLVFAIGFVAGMACTVIAYASQAK